MPTKSKHPVPAAAIKWTDEEWRMIAAHIRAVKGDEVLRSPHLEEIKARDVYDAQMETLPEERHRKLVSIAQGFQTIRERLRSLVDGIPAAQQEALAFSEPANTSAAAAPDEDGDGDDGDGQAAGAEARDDAPAAGDEDGDEPEAIPARATPAPAPAMRAEPPSARHQADAPPRHPPVVAQAPAVDPAVSQFIDMARPFVSMVCQEFARALVQALAEKGTGELFGALAQPNRQSAGGRKNEAPASRAPGPAWQGANGGAQAQNGQAVAEREPNDEEADYGHEPQPLFDPKLPPSPNSDFKPTIGLVGASEREAQDLQAQYPQLQLVSVRADGIKHAHVFQRCQRIIGMQEDIPGPTDEFLGRSLRHRYVRISGGMERVREQLNAWLNKPGSLNARNPRSGPREGKGGNPFLKKRQHRRPG